MHTHSLFSTSSTRQKGRCTPFSYSTYCPEFDTTQYVDDRLITVYQDMMGMLCWICKFGRVDIIHEATLLAQYMVQPTQCHLEQALNIFKSLT